MPASVQGAGVTAPNKKGRVSGLTELGSSPGFPGCSTTDIWSQVVPCWGGGVGGEHPVYRYNV